MNHEVSSDPSPHSCPEPTRSRKVSNNSGNQGYDNIGYESPSRKISQVSEHTDIGPVRKKSILHKNSERELDSSSISQKSGKWNKEEMSAN